MLHQIHYHFLLLSYWVRINSALAWAGFGDWRVRPCFVCHGCRPEEMQLFPLPQQTGGLSWEPQCRISATHDVRTAMMSSHSSCVFQSSFFSTTHWNKRASSWFRRIKKSICIPLFKAAVFLVLLSTYGAACEISSFLWWPLKLDHDQRSISFQKRWVGCIFKCCMILHTSFL